MPLTLEQVFLWRTATKKNAALTIVWFKNKYLDLNIGSSSEFPCEILLVEHVVNFI